MKRALCLILFIGTPTWGYSADPQLVIYNSRFGLVRETLALDLRAGENEVRATKVTSQLDPGTVTLRDPSGKVSLRILEQKFHPEVLTKDRLVARFEGETLPFRTWEDHKAKEVRGRIVRAEVPARYGGSEGETIVEVDGHFEFGLPGTPLFPKLPEGVSLKPELIWKIASEQPVKFDAELTYLSDGLNWTADYNAILAEDGNIAELVGLITIKNDTTETFANAAIRVVAGDVNRVGADVSEASERVVVTGSYIPTSESESPLPVERKRLDEYYEYALPRPITLESRATAQVEFMRAPAVKATRSFVYGIAEPRYDYYRQGANLNPLFGTESSQAVVILCEFKNERTNHLGVPLPRGRFHFYRQDGGALQFTGDAFTPDVPTDEMVRLVSGSAFDLVGDRRQTNFEVSEDGKSAEESFEIKLRNHRKDAVEIRVIEHPARWREWEVTARSQEFKKINANTLEFRVPVKAGEEKILTYAIRYVQLPPPQR